MKIRNGFVSNSSSSSFLIYGVAIDTGDLEDLIIEKIERADDEDENDYFEKVEKSLTEAGLDFIYPSDFDCYYIGGSWDSIKDDETGAQFKKRVREEVKKVLNVKDNQFGTHQEAWFDG